MHNYKVTQLILEAACPGTFPPRRLQIQIELTNAVRKVWRSRASARVDLVDELFFKAAEKDPVSLVGLLPFFHAVCCNDD